jgi:hypothetical protein
MPQNRWGTLEGFIVAGRYATKTREPIKKWRALPSFTKSES